ncbi:MAG: DUF2225 domain-containing protein [Treponema sp.]|jgi:uncharacterized protein (DUF2225 family)|nr:DUF2225 domain-containing protein [Treponema sp.]
MTRKKKEKETRELKVSFLSKMEYKCPVCGCIFRREELLSGGGRLIAGDMTEELHRIFEPSLKYGEIYPLVYLATVCPECWFASMEGDFLQLPPAKRSKIKEDQECRMAETQLIFPGIDFNNPRRLMEGAASQYLTLRCYDQYTKEFSPTIKRGLAALRTAWLLDDLNKRFPKQHYDWLGILFRKKAQYFYNDALDREQTGGETMSGLKIYGPDIDKNYSYEGMLYLCSYLRYKFGPAHDPEQRKASLEYSRRTIAKLFGMGKASKDKPGAFLEMARTMYDTINKEIEEMGA